jgi:2-dehydro-3-deoxyphosphooctonate aldolase (KDO 8-P synthase)
MTKQESLKPNARVAIGNIEVANDARLMVLAGPCQMESRAHALEMASALKEMAAKLYLGLVYKSSFD